MSDIASTRALLERKRDLLLQRKALLISSASSESAAPTSATPRDDSAPSSDLKFMNQGIAQGLGAPVDLVASTASSPVLDEKPQLPDLPPDASTFSKVVRGLNNIVPGAPNPAGVVGAILRAGGYNADTQPIGGSASISSLMRRANIAPREGEQPQTLGAKVLQGVGQAAGGLPVMGGAAAGAAGLDGALGNAASSVLDSIGTSPTRMIGADLASGAGSGFGGAAANEIAPDNKTAEVIGQLLGGLAVPAAASAVSSPVKLVTKLVKSTVFPFTETGGTIRAENRLKSLVPDPEAAAKTLDEPSITNISPAQKIGDDRLLSLENAVRDNDVHIDAKFRQNNQDNANALKQEVNNIRGDGNVADTQGAIGVRQEQLGSLLDQRIAQAQAKADQAVSNLAPEMRSAQASVVARNELESALSDARTQEKQLWNQVPDNVLVEKTNTTDAYDKLLADTPKAQQDDIPKALMAKILKQPDAGAAETAYDAYGRPSQKQVTPPTTETINELQGLRSKLLEGSRQARAEGNFNKARIHDSLADAVLDDIGAAPSRIQGDVGQKIRDALDFSRQLNEKFTRGSVGKVLGTARTGGDKVAPELTLSTLIGGGKIKGDVSLQQMTEAANTPELHGSVEDYLKDQLSKVAQKNGTLDSKAARKFLDDNVDILRKFPELRQNITHAADSSDALQVRTANLGQTKKLLTSDSKNQVSKFINAPVDKEFDVIVGSRDPAGFTKDLIKRAAKDPTGAAAKGLKASAVDYVMRKSMKEGSLHGASLLDNLNNNPRMSKAIEQVLTPDEMQRLRRIGGELKAVQTTSSKDIGGIINDIPAGIIQTPIRIFAAKLGAKFGASTDGASLITANIFSQRAKKVLANVTNDKAREILTQAVQDPQLMKALLTNTTTKPGQKAAAQKLEAWLIGPGANLLDSEDSKKNK